MHIIPNPRGSMIPPRAALIRPLTPRPPIPAPMPVPAPNGAQRVSGGVR